jgi:hypothetical protein
MRHRISMPPSRGRMQKEGTLGCTKHSSVLGLLDLLVFRHLVRRVNVCYAPCELVICYDQHWISAATENRL